MMPTTAGTPNSTPRARPRPLLAAQASRARPRAVHAASGITANIATMTTKASKE